MLAATAILSLIWIIPKTGTGLGTLGFAIPAVLILLLVHAVADPRKPYLTGPGRSFLVSTVLLFASGIGGYLMASLYPPQTLSPLLRGLWEWGQVLWWPFLVLALIARFILGLLLPVAHRRDEIGRNRLREIEHERRMTAEANRMSEPSGPGRKTGFEPAALADVELGPHEHLYGTPGAGLTGSGFRADAVALGQLGELSFARALERTGDLGRFASFWSVHMPDELVGASTRFQTDIDCVLVTGHTVHLIDVKLYTQGAATWIMEDGALRLIDDATGGYINGPRKLSRNMELAQTRVAEKLRGLGVKHTVRSVVVFMPTDNGLGQVRGVQWPGGVPAMTLLDLLPQLASEPDFSPDHPASEHITRVFRWLVKDESGSAPTRGRPPAARAGGAPRTAPPRGAAPAPAATEASAPAAGGSGRDTDYPRASAFLDEPGGDGCAAPERPSVASGGPARTCPECGAAAEDSWKFCYECGATFPEDAA
ncbi:NERD domain-containing protein [Brachybacterium nesterenkovii]|uniref:NERD domain-containing protein n=1 Tax=Brachybacterium nesterenkovii TaxID=47847 RepID=UPI00321B4E15